MDQLPFLSALHEAPSADVYKSISAARSTQLPNVELPSTTQLDDHVVEPAGNTDVTPDGTVPDKRLCAKRMAGGELLTWSRHQHNTRGKVF